MNEIEKMNEIKKIFLQLEEEIKSLASELMLNLHYEERDEISFRELEISRNEIMCAVLIREKDSISISFFKGIIYEKIFRNYSEFEKSNSRDLLREHFQDFSWF